jgi:hypothetical protein
LSELLSYQEGRTPLLCILQRRVKYKYTIV